MALKQVVDVGGQGEAPRSRDIAGSGSAYARDTNFDPTNTDFVSTNLQALGEEIDGALGTKASKYNLSEYILTGTKPSTALTSGTFFVDQYGALRVATTDIATTDDVGSGNSAVKSVGEVLSELNSNLNRIIRKRVTIEVNNSNLYRLLDNDITPNSVVIASPDSQQDTWTMLAASVFNGGCVLRFKNQVTGTVAVNVAIINI